MEAKEHKTTGLMADDLFVQADCIFESLIENDHGTATGLPGGTTYETSHWLKNRCLSRTR